MLRPKQTRSGGCRNGWVEVVACDHGRPPRDISVGAAKPDVGRPRLEAARDRPRRRSPEDGGALCADAGEGAVFGRQGRTRRQIRTGRAQPARRLHARDEFARAAGADLRPWRRASSPATSAASRQPLLRQHHAVGGQERLCRRQHHLSPRARLALAGRRGRPRVRRAVGERRRSPSAAAIPRAST